jgi:hypothetical protein
MSEPVPENLPSHYTWTMNRTSLREKSRYLLRRQLFLVALLGAPTSVIGEGVALTGGVERLVLPFAYVLAPFFLARDALYGSDDDARKALEKQREDILGKSKIAFAVDGIAGDELAISESAVYGMLVNRQMSFIESTVNDAGWLLTLAKDPEKFALLAANRRIVRISLGIEGDPDCFQQKADRHSWIKKPPVRPDTCLLVVFSDTLRAEYKVRLDSSKASKRALYWEIVRAINDEVVLRLPFWEPQYEGQPLRVDTRFFLHKSGSYRPFIAAYTSLLNTFVKKQVEAPADATPSRIIPWGRGSYEVVGKYGPALPPPQRFSVVLAPNEAPKSPTVVPSDWPDFYRYTQATGQPQINSNLLVFDPKRDLLVQHDPQKYGPSMVTDCCRIHVRNTGLLDVPIQITAVTHEGVGLWNYQIVTDRSALASQEHQWRATAVEIQGDALVVSTTHGSFSLGLHALPSLPQLAEARLMQAEKDLRPEETR